MGTKSVPMHLQQRGHTGMISSRLTKLSRRGAGRAGEVSKRHENRTSGRALAILLAAGVSGCMVGPNFETPPPPPVDGYLPANLGLNAKGVPAPRRTDVAGDWWTVLGSRQLNGLIELGLANNADLAAAEAAIRVAEANALALRGGFWPTVKAQWDSSRQQVPTRTLSSDSSTGKSVFSLHTPQVSVGYVPDVWGGLHRQVESAWAEAEAAAMEREARSVTLATNIALTVIQQASFEGQIEVTRRLVRTQSELLEILRRQQTAGNIAETDVAVQETALAQTKLLLPPLERQRDQQVNVLATLTGRLPGQTRKETFRLSDFRPSGQVPVSLPADVVRQRPDIRVAEANLKAANAQIGVAIANRLPQITLSGNGGSTADVVGRLFSPGTWFWMIAGSAVQTVFDGRTLAYKQVAAEEAFVQQTAQYKSVVLTAFQNVADVLVALDADTKALTAAREAETAASRSLALIRQQLDQGQISLPVLLSSQQAFLQTSLARVQAQASRLANTVALYHALGGGWWNRFSESSTVQSPNRNIGQVVSVVTR